MGRGAFSFVLSVERRSSGKPFAAKCVHSQGMARAERREALRSALAEARTLAKLRHPVRALCGCRIVSHGSAVAPPLLRLTAGPRVRAPRRA